METEKLSYYQKNKETILAKRKLRREFEKQERLRLGRPFLKFDDDDEITFDPSMNEVVCVEGKVDFVEPVVDKVTEIKEKKKVKKSKK